MRYLHRFEMVLVLLLPGITLAQEPKSQVLRPPEEYLAQGKGAEFIPAAKAWLSTHPPGADAQRVVGDLHMVATLVEDQNESALAMLRILAEYPDSALAHYACSQTQCADYNRCLRSTFDEADYRAEPLTERWLHQAMQTGVKFYGPKFADDAVLLRAALGEKDLIKGARAT